MKFRIRTVLLCLLFVVLLTGCKEKEPVSGDGFYLDTVCNVTIYDMSREEAEKMIDIAFDTCKKYEGMLSKTVKGSDIDKINRADGKALTVQPETRKIIESGIHYGELSEGKFDITIGAVSELWDFNADNPRPPDKDRLAKAVKTVDYKQIVINGDTVRLKNPDARLDLGGLAKGYIADRVTEKLKKAGVKRAIINLGGNVETIGEKEDGVPWKIGIERPYSDRTEVLGTVEMKSGTIVTSGIYERKFKYGGKLYHHVLDPDTGYPAMTELESATVKGEQGTSMDCDALSTVCLLAGPADSEDIMRKLGDQKFEMAFVDKQDKLKGNIEVKETN